MAKSTSLVLPNVKQIIFRGHPKPQAYPRGAHTVAVFPFTKKVIPQAIRHPMFVRRFQD